MGLDVSLSPNTTADLVSDIPLSVPSPSFFTRDLMIRLRNLTAFYPRHMWQVHKFSKSDTAVSRGIIATHLEVTNLCQCGLLFAVDCLRLTTLIINEMNLAAVKSCPSFSSERRSAICSVFLKIASFRLYIKPEI